MRPGFGCCGGRLPGCCRGLGFRRFIFPAEELERLKHYLDDLKKEMAGVGARIYELKGHINKGSRKLAQAEGCGCQ